MFLLQLLFVTVCRYPGPTSTPTVAVLYLPKPQCNPSYQSNALGTLPGFFHFQLSSCHLPNVVLPSSNPFQHCKCSCCSPDPIAQPMLSRLLIASEHTSTNREAIGKPTMSLLASPLPTMFFGCCANYNVVGCLCILLGNYVYISLVLTQGTITH